METATVVKAHDEVVTLADAREAVFVLRPEVDAKTAEWVAFHRANAAMYERVAKTDRRHHWEALYWVGYEMRQVEKLTKRPEWRSGFGEET